MNFRFARHAWIFSLLLIFVAAAWPQAALQAGEPAGIVIRSGEKIAFLGDSITAMGWEHPWGYVHLVMEGLEKAGVRATPIPAGIGGSNSRSELARLDKDVIAKRPDWMLLSCGVNDVWGLMHLDVPLDEYKTNITAIVVRAQSAGIRVMVLTSTMIGEEFAAQRNRKAIPYNDFLRQIAAAKHCLLADLNVEMRSALKDKETPTNVHPGCMLTEDGVHMYPRGDVMMAAGILKAMGVNAAQVEQLKQDWFSRPGLVARPRSMPPAEAAA